MLIFKRMIDSVNCHNAKNKAECSALTYRRCGHQISPIALWENGTLAAA